SIASGSLHANDLITDRLAPSEAPEFYQSVRERGSADSISPVIKWN
ncbi:MAG: hypothetical protein JWM85_338, partial [Acidimicrobiaceae bacterium]|nr:hypothetical protein [Acidimicrobiaceae bacterium]